MKRDISIYVHIPFCIKKCLYCDFLSFESDEKKKKDYIDKLGFEIYIRSDGFKEYNAKNPSKYKLLDSDLNKQFNKE